MCLRQDAAKALEDNSGCPQVWGREDVEGAPGAAAWLSSPGAAPWGHKQRGQGAVVESGCKGQRRTWRV